MPDYFRVFFYFQSTHKFVTFQIVTFKVAKMGYILNVTRPLDVGHALTVHACIGIDIREKLHFLGKGDIFCGKNYFFRGKKLLLG